MSNYKNFRGKRIKFFTSDLDNAEAEGQVFYSDTDSEYKVAIATSAWSAAPILPQVLGATNGAGSSQDAVIIMTGTEPPGNTDSADSYEYNGSGWAAGGSLNVARNGGGTSKNAPLTACLAFAGNDGSNDRSITESYNGTSWTEVGDMNTARREVTGFGISTAAVAAGGATSPQALTEEFNGSSWTESGDLNTGRGGMQASGFGILTSGIVAGGEPAMTNAEQYNGTSWTAIANLSTGVHLASGVGTTSAGKIVGGAPGQKAINQQWDGTSWTEGPDIATARTGGGQGGTNNAGIIAGGNVPAQTATTEEFNFTAATRTAAAWSSGEALNQIRRVGAGTGTQTSGMIFGGLDTSTALGHTEQYDGTDWTEVGDLNTARGKLGSATAGSQTAALGFGGSTSEPSNPAIVNNSEEFNGTSWSEGDNLNTARYVIAGAGTQTAGLGFGGYTTSTNRDESEEYNGTSWSEGDNLNTARGYLAGCGTQTAGLAIQGFQDGGEGEVSKVEEYNGTSWTEVTNAPFTSRKNCAAGIQTNAITFAGHNNRTDVVGYDGTTWSTRPSMATGRDFASGFGTATAAVCAGGDGGTPGDEGVNTVEEFTGDTTAQSAKTIDFD